MMQAGQEPLDEVARRYLDSATHLWDLHYQLHGDDKDLTESERAEGERRYSRLKADCERMKNRLVNMGYDVKPLAMQARQLAQKGGLS